MRKKSIIFLSKGEKSSSTRYRAFQYFPALLQAGWSVSHMSLHDGLTGQLRILGAAKQADVVVILRHGLSFPFMQLLRKCSKKLIFDFDDAVFLKSSGERSSVRAKRFDSTILQCDQVWAGNHYLAAHAKAINPHTIVLPTAVDTARYDVLHAIKEENFIDVVWIGSQSTSPYLQNLLPVLERAAMLEPRLRLKVIANFSLYSSILPIQNVEWREESEVAELSSAHIGIAPMPDTPWTRGKCALKVLQYMACRLPVVSSDAGANRDIILHDKSGLLAATDQQWIDGLISLAQSPQLRHIMGEVGLGICQKNFSLSSCATLMIDNLRALVMNKQCTSSL